MTYYKLEVQHACDVRGSWHLVHRFSAFCKLHEDLMARVRSRVNLVLKIERVDTNFHSTALQVPAYSCNPPAISLRVVAERGGGGGWLASAGEE